MKNAGGRHASTVQRVTRNMEGFGIHRILKFCLWYERDKSSM